MKKFFLYLSQYLLVSIIAIGAYTKIHEPTPFEYTPVDVPSGCLVDSIVFNSTRCASKRLSDAGLRSAVVVFAYTDVQHKHHGHAICIFQYKSHNYAYDPNKGTFRLVDPSVDCVTEAVARSLPSPETVESVDRVFSPD